MDAVINFQRQLELFQRKQDPARKRIIFVAIQFSISSVSRSYQYMVTLVHLYLEKM